MPDNIRRLNAVPPRKEPLKAGDIAYFINPDDLESCRRFEGIEIKIEHIWRSGGDGSGDLAFCRLPDGRQETFGLATLRSPW